MASAVVDAVFGSYDVRNAKVWRDEDMNFRNQEKQWHDDQLRRDQDWRNQDLIRETKWRKFENERKIADSRAEQLSALSNVSALLAGFAVVAMVEINLPSGLNEVLLVVFGSVCALIVILMLLCMVTCTLLVLAVTTYSSHKLEQELFSLQDQELNSLSPFHEFWIVNCEKDWRLAYSFFRYGLCLFIIDIGILSWVQFDQSIAASISMSSIALFGLGIWQFHIYSKWRNLLNFPEDTSSKPDQTGSGNNGDGGEGGMILSGLSNGRRSTSAIPYQNEHTKVNI